MACPLSACGGIGGPFAPARVPESCCGELRGGSDCINLVVYTLNINPTAKFRLG